MLGDGFDEPLRDFADVGFLVGEEREVILHGVVVEVDRRGVKQVDAFAGGGEGLAVLVGLVHEMDCARVTQQGADALRTARDIGRVEYD